MFPRSTALAVVLFQLAVPAQALSGTVHDPEGRPIEGARVELVQGDGSAPRVQATRADGSYAFEDVAPTGYAITCRAEGYLEVRRTGRMVPYPIDLLLFRRATLRGRVVDPEGEVVTGASIEVDLAGPDGLPAWTPDRRWLGWGVPGVEADGSFRSERMPVARLVIQAAHPDYRSSEPVVIVLDPEGPTTLELRLRVGAFVSGVVHDENGAPVPEAFVFARERINRSQVPPYDPKNALTATDADGRFRIGGLEDSQVLTLFAQKTDYNLETPRGEPVRAAAGDEGLALTLERGGTVSGHALDESGEPLRVHVLASRPRVRIQRSMAWSDPETGAFTLRGLGAGAWEIRFSSRVGLRHMDGHAEVDLEPGQELEGVTPRVEVIDLTVPEDDGRVIQGELVIGDESAGVILPPGKPLSLYLSGLPNDWRTQQRCPAAAGRFRFATQPGKSYRLSLSVDSYELESEADLFALRAGDDIVVRLVRRPLLSGTVRATDGSVVRAGVVCAVDPRTGRESRILNVSGGVCGRFHCRAPASGSVSLLRFRSRSHASVDVPVQWDGTADADIGIVEVDPMHSVVVHVLASSGEPVADARVTIRRDDLLVEDSVAKGHESGATTDAGVFRAGGFAPGSHTIHAGHRDAGRSSTRVTLAADDPVTTVELRLRP